ncbi:MAG: hypothetical protein K8R18_08975 [Parvibaculum sp.]|uniref:hypothetical protein n=1 Tax=Parvibaculum sp. TaxID=2024848 RepID=UPI0025D45ADB|nr:hypothetical protein [Parvibaculum sp.]MCE9649741.1 hypothetical protein [Parvibaculum sp.]
MPFSSPRKQDSLDARTTKPEPPVILTFSEPDPDRPAKEAALRAMSDADLLALYTETRAAASEASKARDMERLYPLVRGMKTIQRIAGARGFIIKARRLQEAPT